MRKIKEVLRLRFELKLSYQQIGRSCAVGVGTVHNYIKRFEASGLNWPLAEDWSEARLNAALYPPSQAKQQWAPHALPDFAVIHKELQSKKGLLESAKGHVTGGWDFVLRILLRSGGALEAGRTVRFNLTKWRAIGFFLLKRAIRANRSIGDEFDSGARINRTYLIRGMSRGD